MATTQTHHGRHASEPKRHIAPGALAVLLVALVAIALMLIGVARGETSPLLLLFPTALAAWALATIRH